MVAADEERLEAAAVCQGGEQGAGDVVRPGGERPPTGAGILFPSVRWLRPAEPQGVHAHAPPLAGIAADLLAEPLGESVRLPRVGRDILVREVALIQGAVVDREAAGVNGVRRSGVVSGAQ